MFAWTINWRRNLFLGMLMLLLVNGFFTHTKQLACEWWVEQERMPGMSWQVVRRIATIPSWYVRCQNTFFRWQYIVKKRAYALFILPCFKKFRANMDLVFTKIYFISDA